MNERIGRSPKWRCALVVATLMHGVACSSDESVSKDRGLDGAPGDASVSTRADGSSSPEGDGPLRRRDDGVADMLTPGPDPSRNCPNRTVWHPAQGQCVSTVDLGADCADPPGSCKGDCAEGQRCVAYATAVGDFCTCAIECGPGPQNTCPDGYTCLSVKDGPKTCGKP